jgi:hypothetical protein
LEFDDDDDDDDDAHEFQALKFFYIRIRARCNNLTVARFRKCNRLVGL